MRVQIAYHDYQTDEQGWVDTILSVPVNGTVRINTMDWLGQSEYTNTIVFWPALSSAIAKVQKSIRPILVPLRLFNYQAHNLQVEIVVICLPAMELDLWFSWEKNIFWQLKVVLAKHATVKVIVAHWAYTITGTEQYLLFLNYTNELCSSSIYNECSGKVEVKFYEVPGWQSVGPALNATTGKPTGAKFPDFT
jgi:phospholipase D3/4